MGRASISFFHPLVGYVAHCSTCYARSLAINSYARVSAGPLTHDSSKEDQKMYIYKSPQKQYEEVEGRGRSRKEEKEKEEEKTLPIKTHYTMKLKRPQTRSLQLAML